MSALLPTAPLPAPTSRLLAPLRGRGTHRTGWARRLAAWTAATLALAVLPAAALPGTFRIDQIYSNASGSVQFVVIHDRGQNDCDSGEDRWAGEVLRSSGPGPERVYVFPANLPTCATSGKRMLVATQGFAALGLVAPDFVIPNDFIQRPGGRLEFAGDLVEYTALPDDGVTAIQANGTRIQNLATNLSGRSASVTASSTPAFVINFGISGTWHNPATPGQGFLLEVVPGLNSLALGWFTWGNTTGDHLWLSGLGPISGDSATVQLQRSSHGLFNNPAPVANMLAGTATFRFTDCSRGSVTFQRSDSGESGTIPIERLTPVPAACPAAARD